MIELLLVFAYVGLSAVMLVSWRQRWRAEARRGVVGQTCETDKSSSVRGTKLRCMIRAKLDAARTKRASSKPRA
jgi:hypothetical protein